MPDPSIRVAILTISDRCAAGQSVDAAGPALGDWVGDRLQGQVTLTDCIPDDATLIADRLRRWSTAPDAPDLLLTTGGTGLSPRDITPEATLSVLQRRHPGLLELARLRCLEHTPLAYLSRGESGTIARTLIINLPGSPRGAVQTIDALADILPHAIGTLRGEDLHPPPPPSSKILPLLLIALLGWLMVFAPRAAAPAHAERITVAAAVSLRDPLTAIADDFRERTGHHVQLMFGSSGQLLAQISGGASIDLYISAGRAQIDRLVRQHLADPSACCVVALNRLVLIAPVDAPISITGFDDLGDPAVGRIAIGEPRTVPAGHYAWQVLEHLECLGALKGRLVYGASVRQVLDYVARAEVGAGLVYLTEARRESSRVHVILAAPPDAHDPIRYTAVVIVGSPHAEVAGALIEHLLSDRGRQHLLAAGFDLPDAPTTRPTDSRD